MVNRKNDCFLLSAIQFIRALPTCHRKLLNFSGATSPIPPKGKELTWAVSRTLRALQEDGALKNGKKEPLQPDELVQTFFSEFKALFVDGDQDDTANAVGSILDRIHDETLDKESGSSLVDSARGASRTCYLCQSCKRTTGGTATPRWVFPLSVPGGNSPATGWDVPYLVKNTLRPSPEPMDKPCDACQQERVRREMTSSGKTTPADQHEIERGIIYEKTETLTSVEQWVKIPPELVLSMTRFKISPRTGRAVKSSHNLAANLSIDKAAFGGNTTGTAKLVAVSSHHGQGGQRGHWTTTCKLERDGGGEGSTSDNAWVTFNDDSASVKVVQPQSSKKGKRNGKSKPVLPASKTATILAYVSTATPGSNVKR